jgi:cell division protein FtsL
MAILNRTIARTQAKSGERPRLRPTPILLSAALAVVAIAILQLYQTSRATTANFQMQRLEQQKLELDASVRQLESEVSTLSSLTRIEQEANRLGLQPAAQRDTVQVNVPLPAQPVEVPSRFAPKTEDAGVGGDHASWWDRLRKRLPF